jgi:hypothetical protein
MHQKINNDYFYYYRHINTPITYTSGSQPFLGGDTTHILTIKNWRHIKNMHTFIKKIWNYTEFKVKLWNYIATCQKKLATHKCVATPWLRTTDLYKAYSSIILTSKKKRDFVINKNSGLLPCLYEKFQVVRKILVSW